MNQQNSKKIFILKYSRDIANLLSKIFADTSLVPSDIVAGLIILSHAPHKTSDDDEGVVTRTVFDNMGVSLIKVESENSDNVGLEVAGEDTRIRPDWDLIKHYYKFAAAAYGYMWWMLQSPVANCCKLGEIITQYIVDQSQPINDLVQVTTSSAAVVAELHQRRCLLKVTECSNQTMQPSEQC